MQLTYRSRYYKWFEKKSLNYLRPKFTEKMNL